MHRHRQGEELHSGQSPADSVGQGTQLSAEDVRGNTQKGIPAQGERDSAKVPDSRLSFLLQPFLVEVCDAAFVFDNKYGHGT